MVKHTRHAKSERSYPHRVRAKVSAFALDGEAEGTARIHLRGSLCGQGARTGPGLGLEIIEPDVLEEHLAPEEHRWT